MPGDVRASRCSGIRESDRVVSAAKLFFAYGLGNAGYFPMGVGRPERALSAPADARGACSRLITRHRPTLFFGVPTLYAAMLRVKDAEKRYDLSSLRLCVSAGEALPEELYKRWRERFGVEILDGIGTTEILPHLPLEPPGRARAPARPAWPVPGYEAIVVDDDGRPVPPGEIGNLRVKGDSTWPTTGTSTRRRRRRSSATGSRPATSTTRTPTATSGTAGRADDMLKVGGIWVSPVEVENTLIRHPAVLEAAVVGHEDTDRLVKPKAFVVLKDPATRRAPRSPTSSRPS